jgi:hypothetical protein
VNKYHLTYRQTPRERYRTEMNANVEDMIVAYPGVRLVDSSGGSVMIADEDAMVADNTFTVEGTQDTVRGLVSAIQREIGRTVQIEAQ